MFSTLLETITSFIGTYRKEIAVKYLDYILASTENLVLPTFAEVIDSENLPIVKKNTFFTTIYKNCGILASDNYDALVKMGQSFQGIVNNRIGLKQLVNKHLQDTLTSKAMSAKSAAIITLLHDLNSLNTYMLDLLYFILTDEKKSDLPKVKFKRIKEDAPTFIQLYKVYGFNFKDIIEDIEKISDEIVPTKQEVSDAINNMLLMKTGKLITLPQQNFVGNPIYHFRMWLIDRDSRRIESLRLKKQLIELRLMELKLNQEGTSDPNLSKQIKYYEEKLADIEYNIEKYEKS